MNVILLAGIKEKFVEKDYQPTWPVVDVRDTGGVWDLIVRCFNKKHHAGTARNLCVDEDCLKKISAKTRYQIDKKKAKAAWCAHMHTCAGNMPLRSCSCL